MTYDPLADQDFIKARDQLQSQLLADGTPPHDRLLIMTGFVLGWTVAVRDKHVLYDLRIESKNGQPMVAAIALAQQFSGQLTPPGAQELATGLKTGCLVVARSVPWEHARFFLERAAELHIQARAIKACQTSLPARVEHGEPASHRQAGQDRTDEPQITTRSETTPR